MADSDVITSVGTTGYSYDNALAETVNGLCKTEVIHYLKENLHSVNDVELATLERVDWFNKTRLHMISGMPDASSCLFIRWYIPAEPSTKAH